MDLKAYPGFPEPSMEKRENFEDYLMAAAAGGSLSAKELERISQQLMETLERMVIKFTSYESSSVRVEEAQTLLRSVSYQAGIFIKSCRSHEERISALKTLSIQEICSQGEAIIKRKVKAAAHLFELVRETAPDIHTLAYEETTGAGIGDFFRYYDPVLKAQEIPGMIDYPLKGIGTTMTGIEYIHKYLQILYMENQFCNLFDPQRTEMLLLGYDAGWKDLLINQFEHLLINAIGCVLCEKAPLELRITADDISFLDRQLQGMEKNDRHTMLLGALIELWKELGIRNRQMLQHAKLTIDELVVRVDAALVTNTLDKLFGDFFAASDAEPDKFIDTQAMSDEDFRAFLNMVTDYEEPKDRARLIYENIHSMKDLLDLFQTDCFVGEEYRSYFRLLNRSELLLIDQEAGEETEWKNTLKNYLFGL